MVTLTYGPNGGFPNIQTLSQEFDKMFNTLTKSPVTGSTNYPPYNLIQIDNDEWMLEFAVAGFAKDEIQVTTHKNVLSIVGEKTMDDIDELVDGAKYLHKGIATRKFSRSFPLPDYTEVLDAQVGDGILTIILVRSVPEEEKPKTIEIK